VSSLYLKHVLVLQVMFFVSLAAFSGCKKNRSEPFSDINTKTVVIDNPIGSAEFSVEIADTEAKRARGLSDRTVLLPNHGMLFIFDQSGRHAFWMKNTHIPLDLIFFDDNFTVVGVFANAVPLNLAPIDMQKDSRYVLEVAAGSAKKYAIQENAKGRLVSE